MLYQQPCIPPPPGFACWFVRIFPLTLFIAAAFVDVVVVVVAIAVAVVAINGKGKELCFSTEVIKREKLGVCTQPH